MGTRTKTNTENRNNNRTGQASIHSNHKTMAQGDERSVLPLPPPREGEAFFEMDVYARFMRHLRHVPSSRMEIKILSSIQFTADMMDCGDALIAKTLVDLGLKAPRRAFPVSFLDFVDRSLMRTSWENGGPQASVLKLRDHWHRIGEDRFASAQRDQYAIYNENIYTAV